MHKCEYNTVLYHSFLKISIQQKNTLANKHQHDITFTDIYIYFLAMKKNKQKMNNYKLCNDIRYK